MGNMVSNRFKYIAVLIGCFAAHGIARAAVVARPPKPPALPTMHQCFFQPDGFFYFKGSPTDGFEDFDHLELLTLTKGGRRPPSDSRLHTTDGKSYRFAKFAPFNTHSSRWGLTFEFETETVEGVSYQFSGKFTSICVFAEEERDPKKAVAEGRLAKLRDGQETATAEVQFTYLRTGKKSVRYPREADDIIAFVEAFSRVDFSVNDVFKNLGTNPAPGYLKQGHILLKPSPSDRMLIKRAVLDIFESKPDRVTIEYSEPVLISYGRLVKKYGSPRYMKLPLVGRCSKPGADCQRAFVGYSFSLVPDPASTTSGKRLEVVIDLKMSSSIVVPRHADKDFLAVKEIRFRRIWRGN